MRWLTPFALVAAMVVPTSSAFAQTRVPDTSGYLEIRGSKIHVATFGTGAPIVFLHGGLAAFDTSFPAQRDTFATFRKVIGIDRPGHGRSADTSEPYTYAQMAADTAAIIEQLNVAPVDIVGISDGGNIGLILARDHPALVHRLVISGANLRPGLPPDELQRRAAWSAEQVAAKAKEIAEKLPPNFRTDYERATPDGADHWMTVVASRIACG